MKITATVTIDGEEVGRQVTRVADIHQALSVIAAQIVSLQRNDETGQVDEFRTVTITLESYAPTPPSKASGKA